MKDGVAYIPCKVANMDDIISRFSVKGCESLDSEFEAFVIGYTEFIPSEYPVVLKIIGPEFTPAEKRSSPKRLRAIWTICSERQKRPDAPEREGFSVW
jgi:hypothetical protein